MTRRDNLLERLEQVNPVPDPSRLYEDTDTSLQFYVDGQQRSVKKMTDTKIDQVTPEPKEPRSRGLGLAAVAAALVIVVGLVTVALVIGEPDVAGGDPRVFHLTFDGEQCTLEGPSELSAGEGEGEVEIVSHNETSEMIWLQFVRLFDGKTEKDLIDHIEAENFGAPSWMTPIITQARLEPNSSSTPTMRTLEPGLHSLVCGTWMPYQQYLGPFVTVTP